MDKRREELNDKRTRLETLRRQRNERKGALLGGTTSAAASPVVAPFEPTSGVSRSQSTSIRRSVVLPAGIPLGSNEAPELTTPPKSNLPAKLGPDSTFQSLDLDFKDLLGNDTKVPLSAPVPPPAAVSRPIPKLTTVQALIYDIPPKERVVYCKEAQTSCSMADGPQYDEEQVQKKIQEAREKDEEERQRLAQELALAEEAAEEAAKQRAQEESEATLKDLSEEERDTILKDEAFAIFLESASKVVERALSEKYDYLTDYTIGDAPKGDDHKDTIKLIATYSVDNLTRHRSVMDLAWSPKFPELLLAAYNRNAFSTNDPDGIVCVWNLHLTERPEFVLHASSDVLTARFSEFHPHLVLGGTYSGQVVIWDTRAPTKLPTLASPLTSAGHTHPVYNLHLVGTHQALNAVSASTDGLICTWQLDMLAQPQDLLELAHVNHPKTDEVAVTRLGFLANETATFLVGTEEGNIYHAHRYERAGSKAGIHPHHHYRGHTGPVTGLSCHPTQPNGLSDFSDLFLTSSFDWSVKLWRAKTPAQSGSSAQPQAISCIHSFEHNGDYVYDVAWSPVHPAMFGVVDGCGHFDLWNLNLDTEAPIITTTVAGCALNKLTWHSSGSKVAIGTSDGKLLVYELGEMAIPSSEDWEIFQRTLNDLEAANAQSATPTSSAMATSSGILGYSGLGSYGTSVLRSSS
ncbi:hypothetical protein DSO57_1035670 [Entomophthora muscae]|uniref:Uncharacterized protein n=1 Tax=Entomophthora muscae TaxID=34485 RepID=A0ACC2TLL3_9FUNG|nr:hypothetical protein DSO57_1035670 [Entomophthora muscae]